MLHTSNTTTRQLKQSTQNSGEQWWLRGSSKRLPTEHHEYFLGRRLDIATTLARIIGSIADNVTGTTTNTMTSLVCQTQRIELQQALGDVGCQNNILSGALLIGVFDGLATAEEVDFRRPTKVLITGIDTYNPDQPTIGHGVMRTPRISYATSSPYHTRTYIAAHVALDNRASSNLLVPFGWVQVPNGNAPEALHRIGRMDQAGSLIATINDRIKSGVVVNASPVCIVAEATGPQHQQAKYVFRPTL